MIKAGYIDELCLVDCVSAVRYLGCKSIFYKLNKQHNIFTDVKKCSCTKVLYPAIVSCVVKKGAVSINLYLLALIPKDEYKFLLAAPNHLTSKSILYYMDWLIQVVYKVKYHGL